MATTTEKNDATVTIIDVDGNRSDPFPLNELDDHGGDIARAAGLDRVQQLSFSVGGAAPLRASVKTSVDVLIGRELRKGSEVRIAVTTADGELLAHMPGKVVAVAFEDEYKDGFIVGSERVHKVKLV